MGFDSLGKFLISIGIFIVILGVVFIAISKVGIPRLPGDILIKRGNFTFFFPIVTSIILSIILTLILNLFFRR